MLLLTACAGDKGYLHNRIGEYQMGYSLSSLKTPPGVAEVKTDPYYVIPSRSNEEATAVTVIPPGSRVMQEAQAEYAKKQAKAQEKQQSETI